MNDINLILGKEYHVWNEESQKEINFKRIYLYTDPITKKYKCVEYSFEDDYREGKDYPIISWKYIAEIQEIKFRPYTQEEFRQKFMEYVKEGKVWYIKDKGDDSISYLDNWNYREFSYLFENHENLDGSPLGVEE